MLFSAGRMPCPSIGPHCHQTPSFSPALPLRAATWRSRGKRGSSSSARRACRCPPLGPRPARRSCPHDGSCRCAAPRSGRSCRFSCCAQVRRAAWHRCGNPARRTNHQRSGSPACGPVRARWKGAASGRRIRCAPACAMRRIDACRAACPQIPWPAPASSARCTDSSVLTRALLSPNSTLLARSPAEQQRPSASHSRCWSYSASKL